MLRSRKNEALIAVLVLVGASTFALARMAPGEERSIPYQGVLEQDGVAVTGTVTMRFGLFPTADANTGCVVTNDCPLWSEEQVVDVSDGHFSVVLGDGNGAVLSDAVLATPSLFLAVAVQGAEQAAGQTGFTPLNGVTEIVPVPLAARSVDTVFAAQYRVDANGTYRVERAFPPGWIGPPAGAGRFDNMQLFPRSIAGVSGYMCTASSPLRGVTIAIEVVDRSFMRVFPINGAGVAVDTDFALLCRAF